MKNNLQFWRIKKNYSQHALGEAVGVQAQSIANYERSRHMPHRDTRRKLAEVLGVPVEQLFEVEPEDERLLATA